MKLVFCSDIHLGALKPIFGDKATPLILENYRRCFKYAYTEGIKYVVIGGDIADRLPLENKDLLAFLKLLHEFPTLHFHINMGNHDFNSNDENALETLEWLAAVGQLDNCFVYTKPTLCTIGNVPFCFVPHPFTEALPTKYEKINVGHFEVYGAQRDNGTKNSNGVELSDEHWLIGHLHTHQRIKTAHYCGNLFQKTFGESLPKGFLVVESKKVGRQVKLRTRFEKRTPTLELRKLLVETKEDFDTIVNKPSIRYKVTVVGDVEIPSSFMVDNPSVLTVVAGDKDSVVIDDYSDDISVIVGEDLKTLGLENFLEAQGLDSEQVERALEIQKEML